ncbi:MAG TPA: DUF2760 domain-containing protein [Isosphaeraceae bacterium]
MNRLWLALRAFWLSLSDAAVASRVDQALLVAPEGPDLRVLAVLQRDGRLIDFLQEDIDPYTDAQIGAAVRDIHRGCRKALREYLTVEPVLDAPEGQGVTVPSGFDPATIRLTGNVTGNPPFQGVLKHPGWRVKEVHLPALPGIRTEAATAVLAPAEVEIA